MEIGQILKQIRQEKELTQAQLAHNIMSRSHLSELENGNYFPSYDKFLLLLNALDVTPSEFNLLWKMQTDPVEQIINSFKKALDHDDLLGLQELTQESTIINSNSIAIQKYLLTAEGRLAYLAGHTTSVFREIVAQLGSIEYWHQADIDFLLYNSYLLTPKVASTYAHEALSGALKLNDLNKIRECCQIFQNVNVMALQQNQFDLVIQNTQLVNQVTHQNQLIYELYLSEINQIFAHNAKHQNTSPTTSPILLKRLTTLDELGYLPAAARFVASVNTNHKIPICNRVLTLTNTV